MARFEDSPDLFGAGFGDSTSRELICEYCGKVYNKGIDDDSSDDEGIDVPYTQFAGKQICYCCFEKIENEIIRRMPDIVRWFKRRIDCQKEAQELIDSLLKKIMENSK